jgi:hypothetical protein
MNANTKPYPYIRAWGIALGSFEYYIKEQIELARQHDAPDNAIFFTHATNKWSTTDDLGSAAVARLNRAM